jgi:hypothetical protein
MRPTLSLVALALCSACDVGPFASNVTEEDELITLDTGTRVRTHLRVRSTFHDPVADYTVTLERAGRPALAVLAGVAEAHHARHKVMATRLAPGGTIAVTMSESLCLLRPGAHAFACRSFEADADPVRATPEFSQDYLAALEWVLRNQRYDGRVRTRAAAAATRVPGASDARRLQLIEYALDQALRHRDDESALELRAHRLRLAPTESERDELARAIREGNGAQALAIARGCAQALERPLFDRVASDSYRRALAAIQQHCQRSN